MHTVNTTLQHLQRLAKCAVKAGTDKATVTFIEQTWYRSEKHPIRQELLATFEDWGDVWFAEPIGQDADFQFLLWHVGRRNDVPGQFVPSGPSYFVLTDPTGNVVVDQDILFWAQQYGSLSSLVAVNWLVFYL